MEELGLQHFSAWRQARLIMGLILKGNQVQWTAPKLGSEARKAIFVCCCSQAIILPGNTISSIRFNDNTKIWTKKWVTSRLTVFLKRAVLKMEPSPCRVQSFSLYIHIQQGDHSVLHRPSPVIHNRWLTLCMSVPTPGEALAVQTHVPNFSLSLPGRDGYRVNPNTRAK